jgi:hypothetical protein
MIVGGYELHLYCMKGDDCPNTPPKASHWAGEGYCGKFSGYNERAAKKGARRAGWVFVGGDVLCPTCAFSRKEQG